LRFIALIPARDGSKRIKNKNFKIFLGKPLIYWTIDFAIKNKLFSKVFISTNSNKYSKDIKNTYKNKVEIILRPNVISKDNSKSDSLVLHFLKIKKDFIKDKDYITLLQPTTPYRNTKSLLKLISIIKKYSLNSMICVHNNKIKINKFRYKKNLLDKNLYLSSSLKISGNYYFNKVANLKYFKKINNEKSFFYFLNGKKETIDLDDISQWKYAISQLKKIININKN
jgi:CMP-N,N'-diacetyllegionaminic acid synthase